MSAHFDALETRSPDEREAQLFADLPAFVARARRAAPGLDRWLGDFDAASLNSREALAALPVLRKAELT
jgi:phenylacetate-CoA ligase